MRRSAGIWLCVASVAVGGAGVLGWLVDWPLLTTLFPNQPAMMPNTALALMLVGAAAILRYPEPVPWPRRAVSGVFAVLALAIGGATLIEYTVATNLGIDRLLLALVGDVEQEPYPGRPSPPTAFALTLLGLAVLLLDFRRQARARPAEWLILGALFTAFVALVGFLYGAGPLYRLSGAPVTGVAVPTGAALVLLSAGLLLARPDGGVVQLVLSRGPGGIMLRRLGLAALLASAVLGPSVTGVLERLGVADPALVLATLSVAMTALTLVLLVATAPGMNRTHEALAAARKSFSDLIEHAPDGIFVADVDGRYTEVNSAGCRMLGLKREEILGKNIADLVHPADVERLERSRRKLLEGGVLFGEWALRRKDGSYVPVEVSARVLADGRSQGFVRDITERRAAQEALRRSQERLELVLRGADLATWDWNVKTGEVIFNPRWAEMRGFRPDEIAPRVDAWTAGIHPDDWPRVQQVLADHFDVRSPEFVTEYRVRTKSGEWLWVLDRGKVFARDERGQPIRMAGTELDITARKRREQEERLLGSVSAALAATLDYEETLSGIVRVVVGELADVCVVETVERTAGRRTTAGHRDPALASAAEAVRRAPLDVLLGPAADTPRVVLVGEIGAVRESAAIEEGYRQALAAHGIGSLVVLPMLAGGETLGTMVLARTTSADRFGPRDLPLCEEVARRAASALEQARLYKKAVDATRARDEVLAIVAHDLRNPLSALLVETSLLRRLGARAAQRSVTSVETIERSARRMARLIDDLLDVTRIEAGRLSIEKARVPVNELVADCVRAQQPLAAAQSVELAADVEPGLPDVGGDRDRLQQVFENLIGNAVKFTPPGGRIVLGAAGAGQEIRFSVRDNGPGIPEEYLPHVFDRFWQGTQERRRGTGLGLSIVAGIVAAHGGRVWVESSPGRGSTFYFAVPIAPAAAVNGRDRPSGSAAVS